MRDHSKLRAFELADQLAVLVYEHSRDFPRSEQFGLTSQMRRAAVSVPSNIVEGCARDSIADYIRFLDIAYGSARELEYQISLAHRLAFLSDDSYSILRSKAEETCKVLNGLIRSLRGTKPTAYSLRSPASRLTLRVMMRLISSFSAVVASDARQYRSKISATVGGEGGGFLDARQGSVLWEVADRAVSGSPLPRSSRS